MSSVLQAMAMEGPQVDSFQNCLLGAALPAEMPLERKGPPSKCSEPQ